jgi:hypothetical protein
MQYDNRGQVSLWKNEGGERAPILSGKVVAHRDIKEGETIDISLWKNESTGNQPALKGKIADVFNGKSAEPAKDKSFDDDLPF